MEERRLIKKIKELRQIKPNQDWVLFTKKEILEQGKEEQIMSWLFTPFSRPALVVRPLIAGVLILAGVFVYLYLGALTPQLVQLPFVSDKRAETEMMKASLAEVQVSLAKISSSLNNLKNSRNPSQALAMTEVIKATASRGEEILRDMKTEGVSKKVLTALNETENTCKGLQESIFSIQKEMIEILLEDLGQRSLSEEDQTRLAKAQEYYNEGKYTEAMILVMRIGNK